MLLVHAITYFNSKLTFYNRSLETWFSCIDRFISTKALSNSVYKATMHHLSHIPHIIEQCSSLRNISVRSLEREIGNYKKKMRARVNADANALNVLERITRFKFLEATKMIDFSTLYNRNPEHNKRGFIYHPAALLDNNHSYPQLWEPFSSPVLLSNTNPNTTIENLVTMEKFISALCSYKRRYLGINKGQPISAIKYITFIPAAKLWSDSNVLTSALFKSKSQSNGSNRGGEYIMFESNTKKRYSTVLYAIVSTL